MEIMETSLFRALTVLIKKYSANIWSIWKTIKILNAQKAKNEMMNEVQAPSAVNYTATDADRAIINFV